MKVVSLYAGADNLGDGVWQIGNAVPAIIGKRFFEGLS